jgi:Tfp pilus assembly pilus retraction ATPase PilT
MMNTTSVRNNIKNKEIEQIDNIIETSSLIWMITLKKYAARLVERWIIDQSEIDWFFVNQPTTS